MTETPETVQSPGTPQDSTPAPKGAPKKKAGGLNSLLLADLKQMAGGLGISGAGSMKKAQLVEAIKAAQGGGAPQRAAQPKHEQRSDRADKPDAAGVSDRADRADRADQADKVEQPKNEQPKNEQPDKPAKQPKAEKPEEQGKNDRAKSDQAKNDQAKNDQAKNDQAKNDDAGDGDGEQRTGRNRRRRGRERNRVGQAQGGQSQGGQNQGSQGGQGGSRHEPDTTVLDDDVLVPAAGILDVLDNYAFVRTTGYLPSPDDVYLSLSIVRRYGLRRGDAIVGQVRQPREGERKEKFNPMVRIDSVNGGEPESAKRRPEFDALTPLHPSQRLRFETGAQDLVGRVVDLITPMGLGQRALITAPQGAGKTTVLGRLAAGVVAGAPQAHLMVLLIDERPEEVTDFRAAVQGEVVASTFDRPPADHLLVTELAADRARRLVELGHDVVILVDGLTRLARAYQLATNSNGRMLPGGVDAAALLPPLAFFGAARDLEDAGSLTIVATGGEPESEMERVLLAELAGAANLRLVLLGADDRAEFPAVDVTASGTRHEERLLSPEELGLASRLRRQLLDAGDTAAAELLQRVRRTQTNVELLTQLQG